MLLDQKEAEAIKKSNPNNRPYHLRVPTIGYAWRGNEKKYSMAQKESIKGLQQCDH